MRGYSSLQGILRAWLADCGGQFAVILGVLAPVLLGLVGGVVDTFVFLNHRAELQETADAAVLAVAREASLKGWNSGTAEQVADALVASTLSNRFGAEYSFKLVVDEKERRVRIDLDQDHYGYFVLGYFTGSPQIRVTAAAFVSGASTICILVQAVSQKEAFVIAGKSSVKASDCSAYSNSASPKGVSVKDTSRLQTLMAYSAGGYTGKSINYSPLPVTDSPRVDDPLIGRAALIDAALGSGCDYTKLKVDGDQKTLHPGTYCNGLTITNGARVRFEPGIYVFRESRLKVDKGSSISGTGIGMVFSGKGSELDLANNSSVSLSAPQAGVMAGILIYGQPSAKQRKFSIVSKDAQKLTGTVYLPSDTLTVGGDDNLDGGCDPVPQDDGTVSTDTSCLSDVGNFSDWTAIVAKQLKVTAGSTLVMNSNYDGSSVPVPDGIGPSSGQVLLAY